MHHLIYPFLDSASICPCYPQAAPSASVLHDELLANGWTGIVEITLKNCGIWTRDMVDLSGKTWVKPMPIAWFWMFMRNSHCVNVCSVKDTVTHLFREGLQWHVMTLVWSWCNYWVRESVAILLVLEANIAWRIEERSSGLPVQAD